MIIIYRSARQNKKTCTVTIDWVLRGLEIHHQINALTHDNVNIQPPKCKIHTKSKNDGLDNAFPSQTWFMFWASICQDFRKTLTTRYPVIRIRHAFRNSHPPSTCSDKELSQAWQYWDFQGIEPQRKIPTKPAVCDSYIPIISPENWLLEDTGKPRKKMVPNFREHVSEPGV